MHVKRQKISKWLNIIMKTNRATPSCRLHHHHPDPWQSVTFISANFPCEKCQPLPLSCFLGRAQSKRKTGGHDDESIASKISKAYFCWSVKAISYHVSKCNPRAISSHVTPSAALSYRTVKLRCLGTLLCLVTEKLQQTGRNSEKHSAWCTNCTTCTTGGANSSNRTDRTPPNEKNLNIAHTSTYHM